MLYELAFNSGEAAFVRTTAQTTRRLSFLVLVMPKSVVTEVLFTSQYYFNIQKDGHVAGGDG